MNQKVKPCLSVVIPCFNEAETIETLLRKVLQQNVVGQVILVDDGSNDNLDYISLLEGSYKNLFFLKLEKNFGKNFWGHGMGGEWG